MNDVQSWSLRLTRLRSKFSPSGPSPGLGPCFFANCQIAVSPCAASQWRSYPVIIYIVIASAAK
jgi:hypothetical protein